MNTHQYAKPNFGAAFAKPAYLTAATGTVDDAASNLYATLLETYGPTEGQAIVTAVDRLFWHDMPVPE